MLRSTARLAALLILLSGATLARSQAPEPTLVPAPLPGSAPKPAPAKAPKPAGPTTIDAEQIEGVSELEVTARGRVEFQREDLTIYSEYLRYNREFGRVEADGGVRMLRGVDRFFGPRLRYNTQNDTGVFEGANFTLHGETTTMRGSSERLEFLSKDRMRLVNGSFTSCQPGQEDWRVEAGDLEIDNETGVATVRDGRFKFYDTTVFPLPYASMSLDNQRKTGLLAPYYSQNTRRGLQVTTPFYWNIAPEYDLTLYPSYMTKRGEMLQTQFRYLNPNYRGEMHWEYMPDDKLLGTSRGAFSIVHDQAIVPGLVAKIDASKVSDARYFVDLSSQVRQTSTGNLQQMGSLNYSGTVAGTGFYLNSMVQTWQTLQDPLSPTTPPYARLPQINFGTAKSDIGGLVDVVLPGEYVRFKHETLVDGTRTSLNPTASIPILAPGYFLTPKIGAHLADYSLAQTAPGQSDKPRVSVPWTSLDAGLVFDRDQKWFGQSLTQTFEPRLFYVYAPYRNQDNVPIFDTGVADFNYAQIFTENRFAGGDRFGDTNQLTYAATSRFLTESGQEMVRATFGGIHYFSNQRVGLTSIFPNQIGGVTPTATTLQSKGSSDLLAAVGGRLTKSLSFDTGLQWDPNQQQVDRSSVSMRFAPEIAKVISASYRYNRDTNLRQSDINGQWPVAPGWYAVGRWNYSFSDKKTLEAIAGMEYNAGCWVVRGAVQVLQAATQTTSTGFFFQMEFNGFGSIGSDEIQNLLKRRVPGYAVTNPTQSNLIPPSMQPRLPFDQVF